MPRDDENEIRARARNMDPITSHMAADDSEKGGKGKGQRQKCLEYITANTGRTSEEVAVALGCGRVRYPRRQLALLRKAGKCYNGKNRICEVIGKLVITWYPGKKPRSDGMLFNPNPNNMSRDLLEGR